MSRLSPSKLQRALDTLAAAHSRAFAAMQLIAAHSVAVYGVEPGDVDNDAFIDSMGGGEGNSSGMTAEAFHKSIIECCERAGVTLPEQKG